MEILPGKRDDGGRSGPRIGDIRVAIVVLLVVTLAAGGSAAVVVGEDVGLGWGDGAIDGMTDGVADADKHGAISGDGTDHEAADARKLAGSIGPVPDTDPRIIGSFSERDGAIDTPEARSVDDDSTIFLRHELSLTDERGTVGVRTQVTIPDRVTELRLVLLTATDDQVRADGFERASDAGDDENAWEWDGTTENPTLTYTMPTNETVEGDGPLGAGGTYRFVDVGDWALTRTPRVDLTGQFVGGGEVRVERENVVDGEGAASNVIAFLGPHEEYVHEAAGQRFRLIVPNAADPEATPSEVFEAFEYASTALQVGARDETVFAVGAPTGEVSWAVRGLQAGDADMWVRDEEPAGTADDVWTHEYVHTRQSYTPEPSARWFTEATATYYAALFAVDRGATDFDGFERALARGEREPDASAVLTELDSGDDAAAYTKGALVAGEIDRRIRVASGGEASLATVFRDMNDSPDPITNELFLDAVEAAAATGGNDEEATAVREAAERFTTTSAVPEPWDRDAHAAAFGAAPAQVGYGLADDGVRATGDYRDRPVETGPVQLVAGETLEVSVGVRNTGGTPGGYAVSLSVDGEAVDTRTGTVEPGDEPTIRLERTFTEPGEYDVRVGSDTLTVLVHEPAVTQVEGVRVTPERVPAGESVVASVLVRNDASIPGGVDLVFQVDGSPLATASVRLDAGSESTVERDLVVSGDGEVTVSVVSAGNDVSTTVQVDANGSDGSTNVGDTGDDSVVDVPGFGPAIAILALLTVVAMRFWRVDTL